MPCDLHFNDIALATTDGINEKELGSRQVDQMGRKLSLQRREDACFALRGQLERQTKSDDLAHI